MKTNLDRKVLLTDKGLKLKEFIGLGWKLVERGHHPFVKSTVSEAFLMEEI